ncbi:MAG TPA: hypothetical protein VFB02_20380 [Bradyrhizobium sp.]|jgi:hypothetical protein|nr:hypothetical protein [Bradyrhizobium sp.]
MVATWIGEAALELTWRNQLSGIGATIAVVRQAKERAMMDVLMVGLALLLFAAAIGYTYACERL